MSIEPDWEAINRDWQESGLPQELYCEQAGVSYGGLCRWRSRQIKRGKFESMRYKVHSGASLESVANDEPDFIPIDIKHPEPKIEKQKFMELQLPYGIVLRMPVNVS